MVYKKTTKVQITMKQYERPVIFHELNLYLQIANIKLHFSVVLFAFALLMTVGLNAACASGKQVTKIDFDNKAQRHLYSLEAQYPRGAHYASVVRSKEKASLLIDSRGTTSEWNSCFRTFPGLFKPNSDYWLEFKSRSIAVDKNSYVLFIVRSLDASNDGSDLVQVRFTEPNVSKNIVLSFHVPPDCNKYSFQIHTYRGAAVCIDDFTITEISPVACSGFLPADGKIKPAKPLHIPKGSDEFTIDLPHPAVPSSISVADFGAAPNLADNTKAFNKAIAYCREKKIAKLIVPKGTYRFTGPDEIAFTKLTDFEFDGQGSHFIFYRESVKGHLINIDGCVRTLFHNFTMDWDWNKDPLASVVSLKKIGPQGEYIDLLFVDYKEFPKKHLGVPPYMEQLDPVTLSPGCENANTVWWGDGNGVRMKWLSGNLLRIYARDCDKKNFAEKLNSGSLFRMNHYAWALIGVLMANNAHLTLENVTLYSAPGAGFVSWGLQHHWQLRSVNIVKLPGSNRPITCTADHHHVGGSLGYLKMINCDFGFGGDDGLNVHDCSGFGSKNSDRSVITRYSFNSGEPVEFRNPDFSSSGFTGKVVEVRNSSQEVNLKEVSFEEEIPGKNGDEFVLFNRRYDSGHVIIRNCRFHDNRARGLLILAHDVLIENNTFTHNQMSAIKIETGYTTNSWCEGYGASNVVIRNNLFENINPVGAYPNEMQPVIYMSVYLKTDPSLEKTSYPILRDILIENNRFFEFPGTVAFVCSARNVIFRDNIIRNSIPRKKDLSYRGAVSVAYSTDVFVTGNKWCRSALNKTPGLFYEKETTKDVYSWDNSIVDESIP
jgi:hypothetical protein